MKLYRAASKQNSQAKQESLAQVPHVQKMPVTIQGQNAKHTQQVKVDLACVIGSKIVLAGWSTADVELQVQSGEAVLAVEWFSAKRPDVAAHLSISNEETGFVLIAQANGDEPVTLSWMCPQRRQRQSFVLSLSAHPGPASAERQLLQTAFASLIHNVPAFTEEWREIVAMLPESASQTSDAKAYFEQACSCTQTGEGVIIGWLLQKDPAALVWVEDESGNISPMHGLYRSYRQDVANAFGVEYGPSDYAGLVAHVSGLKPENTWKLKMLGSDGVHQLAEIRAGTLSSDPVAAARHLFSLNVALADFHNRIAEIDEPILEKLIRLQRAAQDLLPVKVRQLGQPPEAPLISVIIPLYGRTDFVEHQLMEFCEDEWLKVNAEIIYVLDDPALLQGFPTEIEALYRVYQLPVRWVWGNANRGFSGANNLGVTCAKGEYLAFLNSDAFPQKPGWLEDLIDVLRTRPNIGAVGPRLVTAEGSIQHAGMAFLRREDLGIWTNHHPCMGLDPSLDPSRELTIVPAVTGACLVMRQSDFEKVDKWDTGYLIGDFEDSDLCLKLRDAGFDIAYCPSVQLTHLERQSFKLLGNDDMRTRVVIYNAVRHQNKWQTLLAGGNVVIKN
ncbi:glycosyltransferase family 2 protein [Massilia haematophila]|uniref:Glycosyltransferase family 2 protein n=1 Tax=Massilia haematophila TaxID=457923 RepID=A0ABV7PNU3_9BURK